MSRFPHIGESDRHSLYPQNNAEALLHEGDPFFSEFLSLFSSSQPRSTQKLLFC